MPNRFRAALLAAAALTLASGALRAEDLLGIKLSGEVDTDVNAAVQNSSSVFAASAGFQEVTADGIVDGKIVFSRKYTTIGLLDFTAQDKIIGAQIFSRAVDIHIDGKFRLLVAV